MSVLIKGMEMPKGRNILLTEVENGKLICRNLDVICDNWYEVVEVPTPHGRLIDAEKLLEAIKYLPYGYRGIIENIIYEQPTVIEGEGK